MFDKRIRDPITHKSLRDFTDKELQDMLEKNESLTALPLAGICSEILRRMLKRKKEENDGYNKNK